MSRFKKEVKAIIKEHDVRDPRGALLAIERLLDAKITGTKKPRRLLRIDVVEGDLPGKLTCNIAHDAANPLNTALALHAVRDSTKGFATHLITELQNPTKENPNV